ncbi:sugar phosphate isomerase/epimerase family protein [Kibdelosporangium phytohabitans]|uniref:sugar phosphate isomerase/epimerase family protein n=1 Tax=Kibdelosporangium phytohabitans TaxID=860235 RepID=UPI0019ECF727|nr:sugar phosphate isomerase/epimerase [Kibdelosporangium phytohabitans]MBE1471775.1 sugar phosphate isomerase/epimerase [Kibdelosporangium phytohabitans]
MGTTAIAGGLWATDAAADPPLHSVPLDHIGIQLYTVRNIMATDPQGTLNALGAVGYATVGVSGLYGHTPERFRAMMDTAGVRAVLTHTSWDAMNADVQRELEIARILGVRYVVVPSLPGSLRTVAGYTHAAAKFQEWGIRCRGAGMKFLFHNHDVDFAKVDGKVLFDVLAERTDARFVNFELDLYWIIKPGYDPVAYFERHPGRFPAFHVKDMAANGSFEDLGYGTIDFPRIFARYAQSGVREYVVEHDTPRDALLTARRGQEYLATVTF